MLLWPMARYLGFSEMHHIVGQVHIAPHIDPGLDTGEREVGIFANKTIRIGFVGYRGIVPLGIPRSSQRFIDAAIHQEKSGRHDIRPV